MTTKPFINKLTNIRFWIFEAYVLLYAIGLTRLGCVVWDKTATMELGLFVVCLCLATGLITWLIANGKHWLFFGLIYEVIFIILIATITIIGALLTGYSFFNDFCLDLAILLAFIFAIAIVSFLPTLALAYLGYHIFHRNIENKGKK